MNKRATENQGFLKSAFVVAFLYMIRKSEGANYNTLFGGKTFASYAQHPLKPKAIRLSNGKTTSAAGGYQFERGTWDNLQTKLNLPDFSPASQDIAAVELLRSRNALNYVLAGDFQNAVNQLGQEWASLPSSKAGQNPNGWAKITKYYNDGLAIAGQTIKTGAAAAGDAIDQAGSDIKNNPGGSAAGVIILVALIAWALR